MLQSTLFGNPSTDLRFIPNIKKRSGEEMVFSAVVLQSMKQLSLETLAQRLWEADQLGDVDAFFPIVIRTK